MSFQWTVIVIILYCEIGLTTLLLLPIISSRRWKRIVESNLGQSISAHANYYFKIFAFLLGLCFLDSLREMRKYHHTDKASTSMNNQPGTIDHMNMKLFRAQRNYYIAGFSLFLWFVIGRLITLILQEASKDEASDTQQTTTLEEKEALQVKVAELTSRLDLANQSELASGEEGRKMASLQSDYNRLKEQLQQNRQTESGDGSASSGEQVLLDELQEVKEHLAVKQRELNAAEMDARDTREEMDRLSTEHEQLQLKYNSLVEAEAVGDKKSD